VPGPPGLVILGVQTKHISYKTSRTSRCGAADSLSSPSVQGDKKGLPGPGFPREVR